jgi:hypothetical protein
VSHLLQIPGHHVSPLTTREVRPSIFLLQVKQRNGVDFHACPTSAPAPSNGWRSAGSCCGTRGRAAVSSPSSPSCGASWGLPSRSPPLDQGSSAFSSGLIITSSSIIITGANLHSIGRSRLYLPQGPRQGPAGRPRPRPPPPARSGRGSPWARRPRRRPPGDPRPSPRMRPPARKHMHVNEHLKRPKRSAPTSSGSSSISSISTKMMLCCSNRQASRIYAGRT